MKIALIGGTCVGKTSVMRELAKLLRCPTRSCGTEVALEAQRLNVDVGSLSEVIHAQIDEATRDFLSAHPSVVIDGRFLNYVLSEQSDVLIVELTAASSQRSARAARRGRNEEDKRDSFVLESDTADAEFSKKMYASITPRASAISINTTNLDPEEVAATILAHFR